MPNKEKYEETVISVVIPTYNHEAYVEDTVLSVVNQTVADVEIIIIDDGSTDRTGIICKDLSNRFSQIKYISQKNQGAHNALNRGVALAQGHFIAILNSDDQFENNKIENCLKIISKHPEVEFIVGLVSFIDKNNCIQTTGVTFDWYFRSLEFFDRSKLLALSLLNENFVVTTSNMVFTKQLWKKISGFQPLRYCHDLEFLLEAARIVHFRFYRENDQVRYRVHPGNTIKEDINRVRIEIAAVVAQAIVEDRNRLIKKENSEEFTLFREFLRNKNLSDLILLFVMKYLETNDKTAYFEDILSGKHINEYTFFLN